MANTPLVVGVDQGTSSTKAVLVDASGTVLRRATVPVDVSYPRPGWVEQDAEQLAASVFSAIADVVVDLDDVRGRRRRGARRQRPARVGDRVGAGVGQGPRTRARLAGPPHPGRRRDAERRGRRRRRALDHRAPSRSDVLGAQVRMAARHRRPRPPPQPQRRDRRRHGRLLDRRRADRTAPHRGRQRQSHATARPGVGGMVGASLRPVRRAHRHASRGRRLRRRRHDHRRAARRRAGGCRARRLARRHLRPRHPHAGSHQGHLRDGQLDHGAVRGASAALPRRDSPRRSPGRSARRRTPWRATSSPRAPPCAGWPSCSTAPRTTSTSSPPPSPIRPTWRSFPAFSGLGAPWWDPHARGLIANLDLATGRGDLARAAFESIVHQIEDVVETVVSATGTDVDTIAADGGPSGNDWLMQLQADTSQRAVVRSAAPDLSALGVADLAAVTVGVRPASAPAVGSGGTRFEPDPTADAAPAAECLVRRPRPCPASRAGTDASPTERGPT